MILMSLLPIIVSWLVLVHKVILTTSSMFESVYSPKWNRKGSKASLISLHGIILWRWKRIFPGHTPKVMLFYGDVMIACLLMDTYNPCTKSCAQVLRNKIANSTYTNFKYDILEMLNDVKITWNLITKKGETHDNLLSNTFDALLTTSNTRFYMFLHQQKMRLEAGKACTFESSSEKEKNVHNNMVANNQWDSVDPKDSKNNGTYLESKETRN